MPPPTPTDTLTATLTYTATVSFTESVSDSVSLTYVSHTATATHQPDEYWRCEGTACKILGADEHHPYDSSSGLTPTEAGLIAGIVILGLLCIAVGVFVFLLLKKVMQFDALKGQLKEERENRYKVQKDLQDTDEILKAQNEVLKSNTKELEKINGTATASKNPLANIPTLPLRTTVSEFQTRLEIIEGELDRQRKLTREAII
eukprot:Rhum_TRINITY_DN15788_c0_g1::Rhum_TRINITY_DN15788_c0_g1_i1::g.162103::m.162103